MDVLYKTPVFKYKIVLSRYLFSSLFLSELADEEGVFFLLRVYLIIRSS